MSTDSKSKEKAQKKQERFRSPRGTRDLLPEEMVYWDRLLDVASYLSEKFGFDPITVPHIEPTELFVRGVGAGTDIVEKELYAFQTRGGDEISLRPEFTAGIVRAYLQNGMESLPQPVKLYTSGALFRHDRPQAGRYREFYQFGAEILGEAHPVVDAMVIQLFMEIVQRVGLEDVVVHINSIGDKDDRKEYIRVLKRYYQDKEAKLCKNCRSRLTANPLRLLDCKEDKCQQLAALAPQILDHLSQESYDHFKDVLEFLDELEIPYILDSSLVRGLDYYNRTVFEVVSQNPGAASTALGGGGRYDYLAPLLGGPAMPACGFGLGVDRVVAEMKRQDVILRDGPEDVLLFIVQLGKKGRRRALKMVSELAVEGYCISESFGKESMTAQLRLANKRGATFALIVGQKEALDDTVIIRDMEDGTQETVSAEKLVSEIQKRLGKRNEGLMKRMLSSVRKGL